MRILGEWWTCDDGIVRPVVETLVLGAAGVNYPERFLIDTGADRTVLSAALLGKLQIPTQPFPVGSGLAGVSGVTAAVIVTTVIEFARSDGGPVRIRGPIAAFTDPAATDLSILGRDVLDSFDVILSRKRNEVFFLAGNHQYVVQ
jgi:hypothetical protein